jgi:lysozyme family protein
MTNVLLDNLIAELIGREGGYVNDPTDRGGPTKYGITLATLHAWRQTPVGAADVEALTVSEATAIYATEYFTRPGFDAVTDLELQAFLFDFGVNSGAGTATMALQRVLAHAGAYTGAIDGELGPQSKAALAKITNTAALFFAVKCERLELLLRDVGREPPDAKFAVGWANRVDGFSEPVK